MPPAIALVGPTAVGKSALALRLAKELGSEIVNGDALQVYRGLEIGTAKPSAVERDLVRHHLLDILEPSQPFSAGEFARRARAAIAEIESRGRVPVIVSGSGLYLRALFDGIAPIPVVPDGVRLALRARLAGEGLGALYAELQRIDSQTAARLLPGDAQRITRALEVSIATGRPLSEWQHDRPFGSTPLAAERIGLTLPRSVLYHRIAARVESMAARGLAREVQALLAAGISPEAPAFQAIGYREFVRVVRGEWTEGEGIAATIAATRRYAKRQETWWRKEAAVTWFDAGDPEQALVETLAHLRTAGFRRGHDDDQAQH